MSLPLVHQKFINDLQEGGFTSKNKLLTIEVKDQSLPPDLLLADCLCETEIFEIYQNKSDQLIFYCPRHEPQRAIIVDPNFSQGQVIGSFRENKEKSFYPLRYIDIVLYSNWLATYGDLILHASGIALDGKGYCFVGDSGVGKSTLIDSVESNPGVSVLGEDQVILRNHGGQFWIYGTPWHEAPERCSPLGVPLKTLFFLKKEYNNNINRVSAFDGYTRLLRTAFIPFYRPEVMVDVLDTLDTLSNTIAFMELSFELGTDILDLMTGRSSGKINNDHEKNH